VRAAIANGAPKNVLRISRLVNLIRLWWDRYSNRLHSVS